jgi:nicotinamide riboside transporter PnuC
MTEAVATILSLVGYAFNIRHSRWGFMVWAIANTIWIWIGIDKQMWGLVLMMAVYTAMSLYGFWAWSRKH